MDKITEKQIQLVEALRENRISDTIQLLSNGAEFNAKCFFVNNNKPPLHILVEKLNTEEFTPIFEALTTNNSTTVGSTSASTTTAAATNTTSATSIMTTSTTGSNTTTSVPTHQNELVELLTKEVLNKCCWYCNKKQSHKLNDVFYKNLDIFLSRVTQSRESLLSEFLCQCSINLTGNSSKTIDEETLFCFVKHLTHTDGETKWNFKGHRMMTPFHVLATLNLYNPGRFIDYGIEQGGHVSSTDMFGQTALHTGCSYRNAKFVEAIVQRVDSSMKSAKDKFGWQPACFLIKGTRYLKFQTSFLENEFPPNMRKRIL